MTEQTKEKLIAKYTKLIHKQDFGEETTRLENILRMLICDIEIETIKKRLNKVN